MMLLKAANFTNCLGTVYNPQYNSSNYNNSYLLQSWDLARVIGVSKQNKIDKNRGKNMKTTLLTTL